MQSERTKLTIEADGWVVDPDITHPLTVWSTLGYVKDADVKAVVILPELHADEEEGELELDWDKICSL